MTVAALLLVFVPLARTDPRYELGWRLKALERASSAASDDGRARALAARDEATRAFFAGRTGETARALDVARARLAGEPSPWHDALALVPEARLVDAGVSELEVELVALYEAPRPARFELRLGSWSHAVETLPARVRVPLVPGAGERELDLELVPLDAGDPRGRRTVRVSAAPELEERLLALGAGLAGRAGDTLELATARALHELCEALAWGATGETDLAGAELLAQAEACLAAARAGERWEGAGAPGERRLWLPLADRALPVRLFVPERREPTPALVLALHGAGGSENLFFEGYGAGVSVTACAARGWILVAPRLAPDSVLDVPALLDALAARLVFERTRVFVVGHSMGALQAGAALDAAPIGTFRAAALVAGGSAVRRPEVWRELPVLLAAGEHDFARGGVEALRDRLNAADMRGARFVLYPNTEHLGVVGSALPDVFTFFDAARSE